MYGGVEFLTGNVLLDIKSEQKVIGNSFCTPIKGYWYTYGIIFRFRHFNNENDIALL